MTASFFDPIPAPRNEPSQPRALSVAELTSRIDGAIRAGVPATVLVKGEISNLNHHRASGHIYFTLKDARSCIDCVIFRSDAERLRILPRDGDEVLITGGVKVYAQRGRYQLYANQLTPVGKGALELKFQQLKEKLEREGLFDPGRKRQLPAFPQTIALVTSKQAAALQDMLKVLQRYRAVRIILCHVPVQGAGSAAQIAAMLGQINRRSSLKVDLILLARGGGSLEDLWEFNEEAVARAVVASRIPVMTGIGHEVDVSIADLVADYHAHTPTEAAQVAIANWKNASDIVDGAQLRLRRSLKQLIDFSRQRVQAIARHELFRRPTDRISRARQLLDDRERQLRAALRECTRGAQRRLTQFESRLHAQHPRARLSLYRQQVENLARLIRGKQKQSLALGAKSIDLLGKQLEALNPHGVLARGYSITSIKKSGSIVRHAGEVKAGDVLVTRFNDGSVESVAKDPNQPELF